jgi:hypothetical protein
LTEIDFVDARPYSGYLTHAVPYAPESFRRVAPKHMGTFRRALCGVGVNGLQIRLDTETWEPARYVGVDGCDACAVKVHKIRKGK